MGERRKLLLENIKGKHLLELAVGIKFNITYTFLAIERVGNGIQSPEIISLSWQVAQLATCFHDYSLFGLFFHPENGGDMFLRNVS
jgi:hypothetical protein